MKIKELTAGVKLSRDFNSHSLSITVEYGEADDVSKISKKLLDKLEGIIKDKLDAIPSTTIPPHGSTPVSEPTPSKIGTNGEHGIGIKEVGAAWIDKKDTNKLNCKDKETDDWSNVKISDMEVTVDGFKHDGFIFREITPRPNPKMPHYRVYKEGGD